MRRLNAIYLILNKENIIQYIFLLIYFFLDTDLISLYCCNKCFNVYINEMLNALFENRFASYTNINAH